MTNRRTAECSRTPGKNACRLAHRHRTRRLALRDGRAGGLRSRPRRKLAHRADTSAAYFFPFVKITEIVCGALLLADLFVPLAIVMIAPVVVNILLFHLFLDHENLSVAVGLVVLNVVLAIAYRGSLAGLFAMRAEPT